MPEAPRTSSLWADSPAEQPGDAYLDIFRERDAAPPVAPPSDERATRALFLGMGCLTAVLLIALNLADRGSFTVARTPSAWGDIPMTCEAVRVQRQGAAIELFSCRAVDAGRLPPGLYRSPQSRWTSDITRRDAFANMIRIAPGGRMNGWAVYG